MEQNDLTIATTDTYLVISNCLNTLNTLCANILSEYQNLVLDLEAAEVSTLSTSEKEFLSRLAECEAAVISDKGSRIYKLRLHLPICGIKRPQVQLLGTADCELILSCVS